MCAGVRAGAINARARTQSSIAVSPDGSNWLLCNASPDILTQLQAFEAAQPRGAIRGTGIRAIVLVDAQIDHTTGLCMLREHGEPLQIWCTDEVDQDLRTGFPLFPLLSHYCGVDRRRLPADGTGFTIPALPGLQLQAIPISSNAPPYSPRRDRPAAGDNVALLMTDLQTSRRLLYAPALGVLDERVRAVMGEAHCIMADGTCWSDDEMQSLGISSKSAQDMGHRAVGGANGMLAELSRLPEQTRRILIHINNTNPMLDEDGAQYAQVQAAGVELAFDGMEFDV